MIEYLKQYVSLVIKSAHRFGSHTAPTRPDPEESKIKDPRFGAKEIVKELNGLNPRDFEPAAQTEFLRVRGNMEWLVSLTSYSQNHYVETLSSISTVLDSYRGPGSGGVSRQFVYLTDPDLRSIVERDYAELNVKLFPSGAWKSTVVMAGSILEALLFDRLSDPARRAAAIASPMAKNQKGSPIPIKDWTLSNLIDIAVDINVLPSDPANTIHQVLRHYRNFVHPMKEVRAAHACTEAEAFLAIGALDSVCNYLDRNP